MNRFASILILSIITLPVLSCSDDDNDGVATTPTTTGETSTSTKPPAAPKIGEQIERMGRAGITTATQGAFELDKTKKDAAKDAYNRSSVPSGWAAAFKTGILTALAIYDGLDTNCGNQFAAKTEFTTATRYDALAGVIADDQIYVNTTTGTCSIYLAVEANATGLIPNPDCGGRTPSMDVIDTTYSAVAIGKISGVDDGIAKDADGGAIAEFPFIAGPN